MTDDLSVVERLERLEHLAAHLHATHVDCAEAHELRYSLHDIIRDIRKSIEDNVRDCVHCGSPFTFRRSDGDIGCHDCPGIMPRQYRCNACGQTGTRDDLTDTACPSNDKDTHELVRDVRVCPWCGEQGTPHELARHDCTATEVSQQ